MSATGASDLVARQIACGERKSNFGRCGVGRGDGAWWFFGALVTTLADFTTRLDFAGSTPSCETGPFQPRIDLTQGPTNICFLPGSWTRMMESLVGHDKSPVQHARFLGVVVLVCKKPKLEWEMMEFNFETSGEMPRLDKIGLVL